jgi:hypothetical protein
MLAAVESPAPRRIWLCDYGISAAVATAIRDLACSPASTTTTSRSSIGSFLELEDRRRQARRLKAAALLSTRGHPRP